eukprot:m.233286 g.233286  ORF g.233286 m.233286 type:complete len:608 (-) comp26086_c0_seq2:501-2324(-)
MSIVLASSCRAIVILVAACRLDVVGGTAGAGTRSIAQPPRVSTECGVVDGVVQVDAQTGTRLSVWKDIPFGNSSVRWTPPTEPTCWAPHVYNATTRRGVCWQANGKTRPPSTPQQQREDCLTLDVIVKTQPASLTSGGDATRTAAGSAGSVGTAHTGNASLLPVIVWLYGGSLVAGSTDSCPGVDRLAALSDIVLVMPNYRVGAHGFLSLPELDARDPRGVSGNYGLLDQQLALQWVKKNIRGWGGDPDRVTLLGQSSGGTSILALLASPGSRGLFHAAVSLSASPNISVNLADAQRVFTDVVRRSTACTASNGTSVECLLALPAVSVASLLPVAFDVTPQLPETPTGQHYPGLVVVDGVTVVADVATALALPLIDVPLLLQTELAEMDTYENNRTIDAMGEQHYEAFLAEWLDAHGFQGAQSKAADIVTLYAPEFAAGGQTAELPYQVFLAEFSFLCGNLELANRAVAAFASPVYASVGVHPPCRPLSVFPVASAAPARYAGHNWDLIAAAHSWDYYAIHFGADAYTPCENDTEWGDSMRQQWIELATTGKIAGIPPIQKSGSSDGPYSVVLQRHSGPEVAVDYGKQRCAHLAKSLGLDQRFWLVN